MVAYLRHDMLFHSFQMGNTMLTSNTSRFSPTSRTITQLRPRPPHCCGFEIILRHATLSGTPLAEGSACHSDLYMRTHIPDRQTFMPLMGIKPAIPACKQTQTCTLDCRATTIDWHFMIKSILTKRKGTKW